MTHLATIKALTARWPRVDGITKFYIFLRVAFIFLPQLGYIHPDEFFQSTEITAGDILETDSYRPWEFTTDKPVRCSVFVHLFAYVPYTVMKFYGSNPYLRLVLPRLTACLVSFTVDFAVYRISGGSALKIVATSYIAIVYFTRTFSNVTETVIFALIMLMSFPGWSIFPEESRKAVKKTAAAAAAAAAAATTSSAAAAASGSPKKKLEPRAAETPKVGQPEKESSSSPSAAAAAAAAAEAAESKPMKATTPPNSPEILYITMIVCGVFNRPTFLCFAITPFLFRFYSTNTLRQFLAACVRMSLYAVPLCCAFILTDSIYYRGLDEFLADPIGNLVVTPLNFLLYNSDSSNLANHGLHQRWLHVVINVPLLFGLHSVYLYQDIYRMIVKRERVDAATFSLHACSIVPLLALSVFPHQEPRFLLPLIIPFALRNANRVMATDRSCGMWYAFNIYMFLFFALTHQAGVLPMQMHSYESGKVLYFHTYMPPRHLTPNGVNREIIDLKEAGLNVLEDALQKHHEGYLVYPAGVQAIVTRALETSYCTTLEGISRFPHVATEYLPEVLRRCGFDLKCLLIDSLNLNRVKFRCDLAL